MAGLADQATKNGDWGSHKENDDHKSNDELGMIWGGKEEIQKLSYVSPQIKLLPTR